MSPTVSAKPEGPRVVVVFSDQTSLKKLRFLKPGFRHCYALIETSSGWILYDPLSHYTHISLYAALTLTELIGWHLAQGLTVVCCRIHSVAPRIAEVRPFTCVEAVKRILGLQAPWVFTPWGLFMKLTESAEHMQINKKKRKNIKFILDKYKKGI